MQQSQRRQSLKASSSEERNPHFRQPQPPLDSKTGRKLAGLMLPRPPTSKRLNPPDKLKEVTKKVSKRRAESAGRPQQATPVKHKADKSKECNAHQEYHRVQRISSTQRSKIQAGKAAQ